jgi:hypothetical protein
LAALRVFRANKDIPKIPASRFLEVAVALGDNTLFFTVFKFFEARKEITPDCKRFIDSFNKTFYAEFLGGTGTGTGNANGNGNGTNNNPLS